MKRRGNWAVALVSTAMLVVVAVFGWRLAPHPSSPGGEQSVPTEPAPCILTGPLDSVAAINRFVSVSPGVEEFQWGDVGIDVRLHGRRRLWLFADTLRTSLAGYPYLVRNSALIFTRRCATVVPVPTGGALIPDRSDGVGYWPMSAVRIPGEGRDTVYLMTQRVDLVAPGLFGFEILGPSVAVLDVPWGGVPAVVGVHDLGPDDVEQRHPVWGAALAVSDGWAYLYGTSTRRISGIHGFALRVARARPAHLTTVERWRYWSGEGWSPHAREAAPLIGERGGVSELLSVFEHNGRWLAVSKRDELLGDELVIWAAASPTGPFDDGTVVAPLPCPSATRLTYLPLAHPGLLPRPGTVVVSWSRNSTDLADVCADPASYRPWFRRVRLPG